MGKCVLHKRSNVLDKIPKPEDLKYGEIAINYKKGSERINIKNDEDEIVQFITEEDLAHAKYELLDFSLTGLTGSLTPCSNTTMPNGISTGRIDISISAEKAVNWAVASLAKWEVFNGSTRIPAFPIFSFSMNGQVTIRIGFKTTGTSNQPFTRISGAILLKHRS